jgi:hypothetical protein
MSRKRSGLKAKVVNVMLTATKLDEKLKLTSSIMRKIKPSIAFMNIILFNILTLFFSALSISSEIPFSETFFQI